MTSRQTHPQRLRDLALQAGSLAREVERGQATPPLSSFFGDIADVGTRSAMHVAVLPLRPRDVSHALSWLTDRPLDVFEAMDAETLPGLDVSVPVPLSIRVLPDPMGLVGQPSLLNLLARWCDLLVVVGPSSGSISSDCIQCLQEAIDVVGLALPLEVGDSDPKPWWSELCLDGRTVVLEAVAHGVSASDLLAPLAHGGARVAQRAGRFVSGLALLKEELTAATRRERSHEALAKRRIASVDKRARQLREARSSSERSRMDVQDAIAELQDDIAEANRQAQLPDGSFARLIREGLGSIERSDLIQEPTGSSIRLSLDDRIEDSLTRCLRDELRELLENDLARCRDRLGALQGELWDRRQALGQAGDRRAHGFPDERAIWRAMEEMLVVPIRYRGDMPKRGIMQRLGEGRRVAFMVLMLFSLFGGAFSLRSSVVFPLLMGLLFSTGFAYTFVSWRNQDSEKLDKELDRARDSLSSDLNRLVTDVLREKQARLASALAATQRSILRELEESARDAESQRTLQVDRAREEHRERARIAEARSRELSGLEAGVKTALAEGRVLVSDVKREVQESIEQVGREAS